MKKYSQQQINSKFRKEQCLECEKGKLNYTGTSPQGGWVAYYTCDCCGTKYEYQDSDMGQTLEDLRSDATETNTMKKFKGTQGKWIFNEQEMKIKGSGDIEGLTVIANVSPKMDFARGMTTQTANAKLIAAAPDLLEAIECYFEGLKEVMGEDWAKYPHEALQKMLNAVSKATE